ncbi:hypothetical protein D7B24_000685 [Verticillium nonalfalfae]|uniref:Uncharacterized protein n=1 Tax=Verticillium nonalfalfae TaxID=1051616 RepID=A0A3M9YK83_9PEZI|nr:uncharacterized protein D7B24_000685 [Verticillium nonalfalfae]RNJ59968.1 hypothetical protein D7B24_000685 [Verticillium nonalfalfae]
MAPNLPESGRKTASTIQLPYRHEKLPRLAEGSKIQKRAIPRRQQPASSNERLIYVSSSTPFMSVVKRVRKQLDRSLQDRAPSTKKLSLAQRVNLLNRDTSTVGESNCEVLVLGTGKAIEKTLSVASWFEQQPDCQVQVRTRTVATVDDVVMEGDEFGGDESRKRRMMSTTAMIPYSDDPARGPRS